MQQPVPREAASGFTVAFVLTVSLFALWGMGHQIYESLMPQFAAAFHLQNYQRALTQIIYDIVYFVGAIPAAFYARRFGYKAAILFGLGCICIGAFTLYPAAEMHILTYFVLAVAVMACGWIFLEVAANPLVACLGPDKTFVWRLNLAQAFYPLGALAGVVTGRWMLATNLALPGAKSASAITHPYILLGAAVLLLTFLFEEARFPPVGNERIRGGSRAALSSLLSRPMFLFAIAAQFFSVMALAGTWSVSGQFIGPAFPHRPDGIFSSAFLWALTIFAAGRFAGTAMMRVIDPARLLAIFSGGGIVASLIAAGTGGMTAAMAFLASSFFVSITWPTVLGLAIRGTGPQMKPGTAFICMGGAAGGIAYQLIRTTWPFPSAHYAIVVPAVSFAVVLAYALAARRAAAKPA